ncbi:tetratricopeptide repeat protein [Actinacidiphila glaucinigra]|uniref:tetratricopeptide repeat protein n=1 Tax=Actinacidiphila glaucinigra TaxID=235986 RepID=UPI0035DF9574
MKDLLFHAHLAAGAPSLDAITAAIARDGTLDGSPARDTVRRCISDPDTPPKQADVVAVAVVLARMAAWDEADLARQVRQLWVAARTATPVGDPVESFGDQQVVDDLEVHHALEVGTARDQLGALPAYVRREYDAPLREAVDAAAAGRSGVTVLVGGPSTGKTRSAWEAVRRLPDMWRLWHPDSSRLDVALGQLDHVAPRTVVWLNEAQLYLAPEGIGEQVAAGVRALLSDVERGPVLVVATLWSEHWDSLTSRDDSHARARKLLTGHKIEVPDEFSPVELAALAGQAGDDPRLKEATERAEGQQITQYLAGVPVLLERFYGARGASQALIHAAMDARRLGHTSPLSEAFLEAAVPGYLTEQQRAVADPGTWFVGALGYARQKVLGVAAVLEPVAHPTGMGSLPGLYRLADYLDHHARTTRRGTFPPATFWTAVQQDAAAADMTRLGAAAEQRGRYRIAASLYQQAAKANEATAVARLAMLRKQEGDVARAMVLFEQAADAGVCWAWREMANLQDAAGKPDRAEAVLRQASARGDVASRYALMERLERAGARDEATKLAREADGDTGMLRELAHLRWVLGDPAGAEVLFREAGDAGEAWALHKLAGFREKAGDRDAAEALLREAAEVGRADALYDLMELLQERGDLAGAQALLQEAADAGCTLALYDLAVAREEAGDQAAAERLAREAGAGGDASALYELALLRENAGDRRKAEQLAREAASAGDTSALSELAALREKAGEREEAERLAREASTGDHPSALQNLARLREEAGYGHDARKLDWAAVLAGEPDVLGRLIRRRVEAGDSDGAARLALDAANCGYHSAVQELARLREDAGHPAEAERMRRYGLDADGSAPQAETAHGISR